MLGYKARDFRPLTAVSLEDLVPEDNFYRRLEEHLDFRFIRDLVCELYSEIGRPSIDPIVFFKLQLIAFFEGVRSERQLMETVNLNLAHRWFLNFDLTEAVPNHCCLSKIRDRYGLESFQMTLTLDDWHNRYLRQAHWTQDLRRYLFARAGIENASQILEVGCGTGAILLEIPDYTQGVVFGLDIDPEERLQLAAQVSPEAHLVAGDAHELPFKSASFDLCLSHFLLLWVTDPIQVVSEMARVARPGAAVLALAEPDYGGRIDYPEVLSEIGDLQRSALGRQGADPLMGRRLAGIFVRAGLEAVETGVMGGQWSDSASTEEWESEWQVLESDLKETSGSLLKESPEVDLEEMKQLDFEARKRGERVLFVPTFYALGRVPS